ncbi:MAG: branched-chain amino acid ABC transporter permease [Acidiferrobacterales bacterium]
MSPEKLLQPVDQSCPATGKHNKSIRLLVLAAAITALSLLLPVLLPPYPLIILCYALVFAIACLGLNLVFGTTGLLSLGHAAYFGVGAYTGAFLYRFSDVDSFEIYLLSGILFSAVLAAAIGFLCVRATKIHFTILTLAFAQLLHSVFIDGAIFRLFGPVGWALYLLGGGSLYIPRLTILGIGFAPGQFIPVFYYVIVVAFFGSIVLLWRISGSPFGNALRAIRDNETRAAFIGIPVRQYRWYAFIISGVFMGLAGALYGQLSRQITPEQLDWLFSAKLVLATVLGGTRDFVGPVLGAFAFVGLEEIAGRWAVGHNMAMGLLLILVVFAFPRGLAGAVTTFLEMMRKIGK